MPEEKTIEELKLEISWYYVGELQKELWWLKGIVLRPIKDNVKNLIINEKELPNKFDEIEEFGRWKNIINFVVPSIAKQIFDFIKEKKEEIATKTTRDELIALKNEILWKLRDDNENNKEDQQNTNNWEQWWSIDQESTDWEQWWSIDQESTDWEQWENVDEKNKKRKSGTVWIVTGIGWAVMVKTWEKGFLNLRNKREVKEVSKMITWNQMRESVEAILKSTENQKKALSSTKQLSKKQIANVDKQIKNIRSMLNANDFTDEWVEAFILRQRLWDDLPNDLLDKMWHNSKNIEKLAKCADEIAEIEDLDLNKLKNFLEEKKISGFDDEFLKVLVKNQKDVKWIIRLAWNASKAKNIAKAIWWALVLDVAFFWVDVWAFLEARKEAELIEKVNAVRASNKYTQANRQLWIWAASVIAEIIIACACLWSMSWPVWTVLWLAVGVLSAAFSMWIDALYFDVKDFYLQNKEDFIREKKSQINQAVLQWLYNKKEWNTTINEHICEFFRWPDDATRLKSTNDAIRAAIFLDEIENWKYKWDNELFEYIQSWKSLSDYRFSLEKDIEKGENEDKEKAKQKKEDFEKSLKWINEQIENRVSYITNKESEIVDNIKKCKWMKTLDDIIVHSRVYVNMSENGYWDNSKDYAANLQSYKQDFFKGVDKDKLNKLEALKNSNKDMFDEIIATVDRETMIGAEDEENTTGDWNNDIIPEEWEEDKESYLKLKSYVEVVVKYKEWMSITQANAEKIKLSIPQKEQHKWYVEDLLINDLKEDTLLTPSFGWDEWAIEWFKAWYERSWISEIWDDPLYNVLYRLWKELYWYTWNNEKWEIMWFYDENLWNNHWIYYSSKWKVNDDRAIDEELVYNGMQWPFNSQDELNKFVDDFIKDNLYVYDKYEDEYDKKSTIDTSTENIDEELQVEFEAKFKEILQEELSYRLKNNIDSVKNEIITFVKDSYWWDNSNNENYAYIALPYNLVMKARRAWLWDMQKALFKRRGDKWKMEICRLPYDTFNKTLPFDNDKVIVSYISSYRNLGKESTTSPEWDVYTEEERFFIDRVERAHKMVEDLRSCESYWSKEDEIDLPTEVEHLISGKYKERLRFKRNLLVRSPEEYVSMNTIQQYEEFAQYFENLYRWLLLLLTTFKASNDVDSFSFYADAVSKGNQAYFDEKWQLKTETKIPFIDEVKEVREFYTDQIKIQKVKVWDKEMTIQELWNIKAPTEDSEMTKEEYEEIKALALKASNTILTALLESSMLTKDSNWNITNVSIGWNMGDSNKKKAVETTEARQKTKDLIEERLSLLKIPPRKIDISKIQKSTRDQGILELAEQERNTILESIDLQKIIEDTLPEVERQWKRWDIIYDPEKHTLSSWGNEVEVEEKKKENWEYVFYINHIKEIWFSSVKDFLWMANFRNRVMYEYPKYNKIIEFAKDTDINRVGSDKTFLRGNVTLIPRDELNKKCTICKDDTNMLKLTRWLNHEVLNDYQTTLLPQLGWESPEEDLKLENF